MNRVRKITVGRRLFSKQNYTLPTQLFGLFQTTCGTVLQNGHYKFLNGKTLAKVFEYWPCSFNSLLELCMSARHAV